MNADALPPYVARAWPSMILTTFDKQLAALLRCEFGLFLFNTIKNMVRNQNASFINCNTIQHVESEVAAQWGPVTEATRKGKAWHNSYKNQFSASFTHSPIQYLCWQKVISAILWVAVLAREVTVIVVPGKMGISPNQPIHHQQFCWYLYADNNQHYPHAMGTGFLLEY